LAPQSRQLVFEVRGLIRGAPVVPVVVVSCGQLSGYILSTTTLEYATGEHITHRSGRNVWGLRQLL